MRVVRATARTTLVAAVIGASWIGASSMAASAEFTGLNGTYRATSDGTWAKTNHAMHAEAVVTSTWTVSSTCNNPMDCTGQVSSDAGWSAPLRLVGGDMWFVTRDVDNWERCEDGTTAPGHQIFKFTVENLAGWDQTTGPSGACGRNQWLVIDMPFTLVKTG
jgi:hypothetical protein